MPIISITVIAPTKALFDMKRFTSAVKQELRQKTEPDLRRMFAGTTEGWKTKPNFLAHHFQTPSSIGVEVYTNNNIYSLVNLGSPPHPIPARRGGLLSFPRFYKSSTRAGSLRSGRSMRFGPIARTPLVSRHPGFAAREFDKLIAEDYGPTFAADMEKTFAEGIP